MIATNALSRFVYGRTGISKHIFIWENLPNIVVFYVTVILKGLLKHEQNLKKRAFRVFSRSIREC